MTIFSIMNGKQGEKNQQKHKPTGVVWLLPKVKQYQRCMGGTGTCRQRAHFWNICSICNEELISELKLDGEESIKCMPAVCLNILPECLAQQLNICNCIAPDPQTIPSSPKKLLWGQWWNSSCNLFFVPLLAFHRQGGKRSEGKP